MWLHRVEHLDRHRSVLCATEEFEVDRLADNGGHIRIGHGRGPGFGPVDQPLLEPIERFLPRHWHRVKVEQLHCNPTELRAGHAVLGTEQFLELGHSGFVSKRLAHLKAAQFAMREQEL